MKIEIQKENVKTLLQLIKENPDLEILPMVDSACVFDDSYASWMAKWGSAKVTKYWCEDEKMYQYDEFEDLVYEWIDNNYEEFKHSTDGELEEMGISYVDSLDWKDAIIVCIDSL